MGQEPGQTDLGGRGSMSRGGSQHGGGEDQREYGDGVGAGVQGAGASFYRGDVEGEYEGAGVDDAGDGSGGGVGGSGGGVGGAPGFGRLHPDLGELLRRFASIQIRNAGTVGGNIANGSPIGDLAPALIALGATLRLRRGATRRELSLEAFFLAYGKQNRAPGPSESAHMSPP